MIATAALIALNVIFSVAAFRNQNLFERFNFHTGRVLLYNEWYRVLTSSFLHVNIMHLLFNMISLYSFGPEIESRFGWSVILFIYSGGMIAGDLLALYLNKNNYSYQAVGASGAVSAVIFASILFFPGGSIYIFPIPVPIPSYIFGFLFIAVSVWGIGRTDHRIGHEAHLGGAAWGVISALMINPMILFLNTLASLFVIIPLAAFAYIIIYRPEWIKTR